jgi:hypothetical protein
MAREALDVGRGEIAEQIAPEIAEPGCIGLPLGTTGA